MRGLAKEYGGRVEFVRVNVLDDDNAPLLKQFAFSTTPELYLVDGGGRVLAFWNDEVTADELRAALDDALAGSAE